MARVSIVTPAYNPGRFLRDAIGSVLAQTFTDWEWVIVDDGSTEDLSWADQVDDRIRLLVQPNAGMAAARNAAIAATTGEYVAFLDADDEWTPGKLETQIAVLDAAPNLGMLSMGFVFIDEHGVETGPGWPGGSTFEQELRGCGHLISTVCARRSALHPAGFEPYTHVADWAMWLRIAERHDVSHLGGPWVRYRRHGANQSRKYRELHDEAMQLLGNYDHPAARVGEKWWNQLAGTQAFDDARSARSDRDWRRFAAAYTYALRRAPAYTARSTGSFVLRRGE